MKNDASAPSSILRGVQALMGVAEMGHPVSLGVLAAALDLPPSTAHRILVMLRQAGYVTQDAASGGYLPGGAFLRIATMFSEASIYPRTIRDVLSALVGESGESAYYGAFLGEMQRFRFLSQFLSEHAVQYVARKDKDHSLLWGASGRSIAAFLPEKTVKAIYDKEHASGEGYEALPNWTEFKTILAGIREKGFVESHSQRFHGAHSVAAPVTGMDDLVIGCVGISMPIARLDESRIELLGALVMGAASELSRVAKCAIGDVHAEWS